MGYHLNWYTKECYKGKLFWRTKTKIDSYKGDMSVDQNCGSFMGFVLRVENFEGKLKKRDAEKKKKSERK